MGEASTSKTATRKRYLLVRSGSATFAIPIHRVKRVLRSSQTFPVPGSRDAFLGLLQYDGEPVIALELRALVEPGSTAGGELPFAIIVNVGPSGEQEQIALAVDDALTIGSISDETMSIVNDGLIKGETVIDGQVVRILDVSAIGTTP